MTFLLYLLLLIIFFNFFILGIFFSDIEVNIKELKIEKDEKETFYTGIKKANIDINLYFFKLIKILKIKINENCLIIFGKRIDIKQTYNKEKNRKFLAEKIKELKDNYKDINFKYIKPNLSNFRFKLEVGTENATITSFLTFTISSILTYILKKSIKIFNPEKYNYKITPIYSNSNYFSASLNSKIKFDTLNLITFAKQFEKVKSSKNIFEKNKLNNKYKEYGIIR